ncbi:MAG: hypothetical protein EA350_04240 [Gemmatimonadales bacterium]|nr:MAG: hypothetical protein EA350_04240 [Gemmatimonadales bacterium]
MRAFILLLMVGLLPAPAAHAQESHWKAGAVSGAAVGAGATAVVLWSGDSTSLCNRDRNQDAIDSSYCVGLVVAGGVLGSGIGAWLGSRIPRERREALHLDHLRLSPGRGGAMAVAVAFPVRGTGRRAR